MNNKPQNIYKFLNTPSTLTKFRLAFAALLLLMTAGAVGAVGTATITKAGNDIWVGDGWANLTDIQTTVDDTTYISVSGTVFLLESNKTLHVNTTATFYLNDTDATELRLNSTSQYPAVLWVNGSLEGNNSKIFGWNTTQNDYEFQNASAMLDDARAYIRFGTGSNNVYANISNSEIAYLGWNSSSTTVYTAGGIYAYQMITPTWNNVSIHDNYLNYFTRSDNITINNSNIYNNSYRGLMFEHYNDDIVVNNTALYHHNYIANLNNAYGAAVHTTGQTNNNTLLNNVTIYDINGADLFLGSGENATIRYSNVTGTSYDAAPVRDRGLELNGVTVSTAEYNTVHDQWRGLYDVYGGTNIFRYNTIYNSSLPTATSGGLVLYNVTNMVSRTVYNNTLYNNTNNILFMVGTVNTVVANTTILDIYTQDRQNDVYVDSTTSNKQANANNTVLDLDDYNQNVSVYMKGIVGGYATLFINYSSNKIMNATVLYSNFYATNRYTPTESSVFINHTSDISNQYLTFVNVYNSTLRPSENSTIVDYSDNDRLTIDYQNLTIQYVNFTLASITTMNVILNNVATGNTYTLYYSGNNSLISSQVAAGPVYFNESLGNDDYYILEQGAPSTFTPPAPTNLSNTTGNFWVNHTWVAGAGNVTDSYNVSVNGNWYNGTTNTYNLTTVSASEWVNISVWAFNSSGGGTLSASAASMNTQAPAATTTTSCTSTEQDLINLVGTLFVILLVMAVMAFIYTTNQTPVYGILTIMLLVIIGLEMGWPVIDAAISGACS